MEFQYFCEPQSGKSVHELLKGVMFAYDFHLDHLRDHLKSILLNHNS